MGITLKLMLLGFLLTNVTLVNYITLGIFYAVVACRRSATLRILVSDSTLFIFVQILIHDVLKQGIAISKLFEAK